MPTTKIDGSGVTFPDATVQATKGVMTYTEIAPANKVDKTGGGGAWQDWDMSAIIPAGARVAEISMEHDTNSTMGVRANGSALTRSVAGVGGTTSWRMTVQVLLDAGRIIEVWNPLAGAATYRVWGYWS